MIEALVIAQRPAPRFAAAVVVTLIALILATPASAYVGPGAGLTMVGSLAAVIAAAALAVLGLVLFPIRMAMKKMRAAKAAREDAAMPDADPS